MAALSKRQWHISRYGQSLLRYLRWPNPDVDKWMSADSHFFLQSPFRLLSLHIYWHPQFPALRRIKVGFIVPCRNRRSVRCSFRWWDATLVEKMPRTCYHDVCRFTRFKRFSLWKVCFCFLWEFFLSRCEVQGQGCHMCTDSKALWGKFVIQGYTKYIELNQITYILNPYMIEWQEKHVKKM